MVGGWAREELGVQVSVHKPVLPDEPVRQEARLTSDICCWPQNSTRCYWALSRCSQEA